MVQEVSLLQRVVGLRPRSELIVLLMLGLVLSISFFVVNVNYIPFLVGWNLLILTIACLDLPSAFKKHEIDFSRSVPDVVSCGDEFEIKYSLRSPKQIELAIFDEHPSQVDFFTEGHDKKWLRTDEGVLDWSQKVRAEQRGHCRWTKANLIIRSSLRMWEQRLQLHEESTPLKIFPRISASDSNLYDPALLLAELGIRQKLRRRGGGQEFSRLRPLSLGDSIRRIDWRATARSRRYMVREYQPDERFEILLCLDYGRLMSIPNANGRSKLEYAIDAAVRFAFVALASGDKVGMLTFAERIQNFVPPADGTMQFRLLLESVYDLKGSQNESNFAGTFSKISRSHSKRSLVVFFTDFVDSRSADEMLDSLGLLVKKHRVLFVSISDPAAESIICEPVQSEEELSLSLAALHLSVERERLTHHIARLGIEALDLGPEELTAGSINAYLKLRAQGDI